MTIKERKLIIRFLKRLEIVFNKTQDLELNLLKNLIIQLEKSITATPTLSDEEVQDFFSLKNFGMAPHYLRDKPVDLWDEYDKSNYMSLLQKRGKTKKVFAIYFADVENIDKYLISSQPKYFFDTLEEAEVELERILSKGDFQKNELKIMSLWHIKS